MGAAPYMQESLRRGLPLQVFQYFMYLPCRPRLSTIPTPLQCVERHLIKSGQNYSNQDHICLLIRNRLQWGNPSFTFNYIFFFQALIDICSHPSSLNHSSMEPRLFLVFQHLPRSHRPHLRCTRFHECSPPVHVIAVAVGRRRGQGN